MLHRIAIQGTDKLIQGGNPMQETVSNNLLWQVSALLLLLSNGIGAFYVIDWRRRKVADHT